MEASATYHTLKVVQILDETKSAKTFVLEPLDGWLPVYKPGQFVTLIFETPHGEKRRSYSISSCPAAAERMQITVKKMDNGEFSRHLIYKVKVGDVLKTSGVSGFFVLPGNMEQVRQVVFVAAGSGIVPCFGLIKTVLFSQDQQVVLIYSNRSEEDTIFLKELRELEKKFSQRFRIKFLFSNIQNVYESRLSNWLLPQLLAAYQHVKDEEMLFYICGPFDYMRMVEITLRSRYQRWQIIKENFDSSPRLILPEPPDREPHRVTYTYAGQTRSVMVQYPVSILASVKKTGRLLPFSCEAGRCGACTATCVSGTIWMAYNEVLTEKEMAAGRILTCQAFAVGGDVEIVVD